MAAVQTNAGGMAMPLGFKLARGIVTPAEEATLIALIEASGLEYSPYDLDNWRSTKSYGWKYVYLNDSFRPCARLPEGFMTVRDRAAEFAGVDGEDLTDCLLNHYDPGAIVRWHFEKSVWEQVVGISLGAPATLELRRQAGSGHDLAAVEIPPRSMYLLSGDARHLWQHGFSPIEEMRWSIIFRSFSDKGRRLLAEAA